MRKGAFVGLVVITITALLACQRQRTTELRVEGRASSAASIAAHKSFVAVAWAATSEATGTDIFAAVSRDAGGTFAPPVRVNDLAGDARVNGEQPPRVVVTPGGSSDPLVTVLWTSRRAAGTALLLSHSTDGARSFSPAASVAGADAAGNRGWASLTSGSNGQIITAWLDHRDLASPASKVAASAHDHHGAAGASASERSQLFVGAPGVVTGHSVARGVCYCCKTAIATGTNGTVYVAWRHVYPGNYRDIAVTASHDGGQSFTPPSRISMDGWAVDGCPENGPALAVDRRNVVHVAWPTVVGAEPPGLALFYSQSADGQTFLPRQRVGTGAASHVQMALDARDRVALVWDEVVEGQRQIMLSRASDATGSFTIPVPVSASPAGAYPAIAALENALIVVWTAGPPASSVISVAHVRP